MGHEDLKAHWVGAGHLKVGDKIREADGTTGVVANVLTVQKTREMFNLTVDTAHTFYVGTDGWLVHNCANQIRELFSSRRAALEAAEARNPTGWTRAEGKAGQPSHANINDPEVVDLIKNTPGAGSVRDWSKVYIDGFDQAGNPSSLHCFTNTKTGQIFNPKFKATRSNSR